MTTPRPVDAIVPLPEHRQVKVLYHLTSPEPAIPGTDAVFQEVDSLAGRFHGERVNLFPLRRPSRLLPAALYGYNVAGRLRELDSRVDLHHVYHATLRPFPVLRRLTRPVVYSVVAGLSGQRRPSDQALRRVHVTVVSNERDAAILDSWGVKNYRVIRPGIDLSRFAAASPPPASGPFTLLMGSAPWIGSQFAQKGFDLVLESVRRRADLRVVLLWRGLLRPELQSRIDRLGVADRVEVLDGHVDVEAALGRVHAVVVLARSPRIVKAYPHSLIEGLAAGRPVMLSRTIPMADYVAARGCGVVVEALAPESFEASLDGLIANYARLQRRARPDFALEGLLDAYGSLYRELALRASP